MLEDLFCYTKKLMETILELKNVTKDFYPPLPLSRLARLNFKRPSPVRALDNISFTLKRGSILAILGPNGAGKTTLLKILSTLILPDKGSVSINGNRVGRDDEKIKSQIGLAAADERSFYWRLTGRQNLDFFAALYGLSKKITRDRLNALFAFFKIDYADRRFDVYSAGMKKKFSIIRALLHDPEVLLLDEPTKSLDYHSACELKEFIKKLSLQGKTVLFATHDMKEAGSMSDLIAIFNKGRISGLGNHEELLRQINVSSAELEEIYIRLTQNA